MTVLFGHFLFLLTMPLPQPSLSLGLGPAVFLSEKEIGDSMGSPSWEKSE